MRFLRLAVCLSFAIAIVGLAGTVTAADPPASACNICTCASGEIACGDAATDVIDEQGLCASLCAGIGSSGTSGPRFVDAPCSELPPCGHVGVPAAGPLWLGVGVVGLVGLGAFGLRRARRRPRA